MSLGNANFGKASGPLQHSVNCSIHGQWTSQIFNLFPQQSKIVKKIKIKIKTKT